MLTPARLKTMLGVRPDQYRDFAALRGDASDNLPGVRGIGPKTAATLLRELGSARAAFDDVASGGERVATTIGSAAARRLAAPGAREAWELNCQVMAMHDDVALGLDAGAGLLPLAVENVRATFLAQQLTWTASAAVRVLCDHESGEVDVPPEPDWSAQPYEAVRGWSGARQRFARLPAPEIEQPALF